VVPDPGVTGGVTVINTALGPLYFHGSSEPTGIPEAGYIQTADGAWWIFRGGEVAAEAFGAVGDGVTDDSAALLLQRDFCAASGAVMRLPSPLGYALSEDLKINTANFTMIGNGTDRPVLWLNAAGARVSVGRVAGCKLIGVNINGAPDNATPAVATNCFVALPRGGEDTGITGANRVQLIDCLMEITRGSVVVMGRDTTEAKISGGRYGRAGRVVEETSPGVPATGTDRFPDGHPDVIDWQGNGTLTDVTIRGGAGRGLGLYAGPDDSFGVWEEVHCRAHNVRVQGCFLGLVRVVDDSANRPVSLLWNGGYMENPGTVQDATTSGGSSITQATGDDVRAIEIDGPNAEIAIEGPIKIQQRRARDGLRVINGGHAHISGRGQTWRSQESLGSGGGLSGATMFATDGNPKSRIYVADMPTFRSETNVIGAIDELGPNSRPMLSALIRRNADSIAYPVIFGSATPYLTLMDGTDIAQVTSTNGLAVSDPLTLSTDAAAILTGDVSRSVMVAEARNDTTTPKRVSATFTVPPSLEGRWLGLYSLVRYYQVGSVFGGSDEPIRHALQIVDVTGEATYSNVNSTGVNVPAPGEGNWGEWLGDFLPFFVKSAGDFRADCFLTSRSNPSNELMAVRRFWVAVLDGSTLASGAR